MRSRIIMGVYRFGHWAYSLHGGNPFRPILLMFASILHSLVLATLHCEIPFAATIGKGLVLSHGGHGIVMNSRTVLGSDVIVSHLVTFGGKGTEAPTVGDRVYIGCGAVLIGGVHIGDDARIGANSVVLDDVPPGTTAVGAPAKAVKNWMQADGQ